MVYVRRLHHLGLSYVYVPIWLLVFCIVDVNKLKDIIFYESINFVFHYTLCGNVAATACGRLGD